MGLSPACQAGIGVQHPLQVESAARVMSWKIQRGVVGLSKRQRASRSLFPLTAGTARCSGRAITPRVHPKGSNEQSFTMQPPPQKWRRRYRFERCRAASVLPSSEASGFRSGEAFLHMAVQEQESCNGLGTAP